jgi:hypothetical protein
MTGGKKEGIVSAKDNAKNVRVWISREKRRLEKIVKNWSANNFNQRKLFWDTPVYTMC